jgi:hypothetical protein
VWSYNPRSFFTQPLPRSEETKVPNVVRARTLFGSTAKGRISQPVALATFGFSGCCTAGSQVTPASVLR